MSGNHKGLNNIHARSEYVILKYASGIIDLIHLSLYSSKNINVCILIKVYRTDQTDPTDQDL